MPGRDLDVRRVAAEPSREALPRHSIRRKARIRTTWQQRWPTPWEPHSIEVPVCVLLLSSQQRVASAGCARGKPGCEGNDDGAPHYSPRDTSYRFGVKKPTRPRCMALVHFISIICLSQPTSQGNFSRWHGRSPAGNAETAGAMQRS